MPGKTDSSDANQKWESKKAAVLGNGEKKNISVAIIASVLIILVVAGYLLIGGKPVVEIASASSVIPAADSTRVNLAVSDFNDGQARFYTYDDGKGPVVRYYAVKGSDGRIHTAYDACDACWTEGKGYKQSGDLMLCKNCGRTFSINKIGEVHGGCNPSPLPSRVENGTLLIDVAEIAAGRRYFDLLKKI